MAKEGRSLLEVTDLSKRLASRHVLDRVSLTLARGEIGVVLGENGSGKSTLLRLVCGILTADGGDISIDGISMRRDEARAKAKIGYVPDASDALPELLVREFIDLVAALKRASIPAPIAPAEPWPERLGLRSIWGQSIGSSSFGQRKRMCILAALVGDPPLLVLDEPSNGLDPDGVALVAEIVHERQRREQATLLSTNDAAFAARIGGTHYRLARGTLTRG
jgi:ABC-type multidrug transport system ATPase subunit